MSSAEPFSAAYNTLTVLPLCKAAPSTFQQLRGSKSKKSKKRSRASEGAGPGIEINDTPLGVISGIDLCHHLLLLPFLLFDLLLDEVNIFNSQHGTAPCTHILSGWQNCGNDCAGSAASGSDALTRRFVSLCSSLLPFTKHGGFPSLFLRSEKVYSVVHLELEIMHWGNLINSSCLASLLRLLTRSSSKDLGGTTITTLTLLVRLC